MLYKASAPGSLMLMGEYAVLHGHQAVVCALDKRMYVTLRPRADNHIHLHSTHFGEYHTTLDAIEIKKPFQFVLATLKSMQLTSGCDISITADFSSDLGFGSSAAVTVATLAALNQWQNPDVTPIELIKQGAAIIRSVQGVGSGADVAASVLGGVVAFRSEPLEAEKIPMIFPISVMYCGFKTPTVTAIQFVKEKFKADPIRITTILEKIGVCAADAVLALKEKNLARLAELMTAQQICMTELGVTIPELQSLIDVLLTEPQIKAAKISGSGLGDCVVGLGHFSSDNRHLIPVCMSQEGVRCEKI